MRQKASAHTNFSPEDIWTIRAARDRGEDPRAVADIYGVAPSTIRKIWRGETFRHVGQPGPGVVVRPTRPPANPLGDEPTEEDIRASQEKLRALLAEEGKANGMLEELKESDHGE